MSEHNNNTCKVCGGTSAALFYLSEDPTSPKCQKCFSKQKRAKLKLIETIPNVKDKFFTPKNEGNAVFFFVQGPGRVN